MPITPEEKQLIDNCNVNNLQNTENFVFHIFGAESLTIMCQEVSIPSMSVPGGEIGFPDQNFKFDGDHFELGDLSVTFKLENNLDSYINLYNWLRKKTPQDFDDYDDRMTTAILSITDTKDQNNPVVSFVMTGVSIVELSEINFRAVMEDEEPITITAQFRVNDIYIDTTTDKNT